jgi:uncharacterized membrane protein
MAYCSKCGAVVDVGAAFCSACGTPQGSINATAPPPGSTPSPPGAAQTGIEENVAGALCYALGWITGLVFFLIDKRPYVRFHAAQSIVVFGGLHIVYFVLGMIFGIGMFSFGGFTGIGLGWALFSLLDLVVFILWILLMIKAYQGERFRIPIAADFAEQIFGKGV